MDLRSFLLATLSLLAGLTLGERLPDVDQHTSLLVHRSILTHGLLLPMCLFWFAVGTKANSVRMFAMGSCLGVGVHLSYDLFPKAWVGFALIHVPVIGWTYPAVSWLWIAFSIIGSLYLSMRLVKSGIQGVALVLGVLGMFVYAGFDEVRVWGPAVSMMMGTVIGLAVILWRASPEDN